MSGHRVAAVVLAMVLLISGVPTDDVGAEPIGATSNRSVAREPQHQPDQLGNGVVDGLQYANPTEGLAMVSPPV